jgi:protein-L-isoaspartate(D-aspartate) O-methyltransferase
MAVTATGTSDPAQLRAALAKALVAKGSITDERVEAAFRTVPRHLFAPPGTSREAAYADDVIRTKFDLAGACLSSVSAPWLQAVMIRQAGIRPGMRVLEVGSGGCNAALLAEVTGPDGHVVSIDIDPEVTAAAATALNAAGYARRVTVITGDAEHGVPGHAPFDAVIVTAGAPGIAPSWISQAAEDATLVVPLRMNGWTRSIAFRKAGRHLASTSVQPCGFVPVQGDGALIEQATALDTPGGGHALVRAEDPAAGLAALPWDLLSDGPHYTWSEITIGGMVSHADLYLWLGGFTPGSCKISAEDGAQLPGDPGRPGKGWFPAAVARSGSLAYHVTRKTPAGDYEFGACAYGPRASEAAEAFLTAVAGWTRHGRNLTEDDAFAYWPAGTTPAPAGPGPAGAFPMRGGGTLTISWPPEPGTARPSDSAAAD